MSVIQESVKKLYIRKSKEFSGLRDFGNKLPSCPHSYFSFIWVQAKCLQFQLHIKKIKKENGSRIFSISHIFSHLTGLHIGRHLGYIEMLNGASGST